MSSSTTTNHYAVKTRFASVGIKLINATVQGEDMQRLSAFCVSILWLLCAVSAGAQEKVVVSHTTRGSLSIGSLLYGIERGFYREEGIDLVYVSIRADLGIKALISGDVDYLYSVGTIIRGAALGIPVKTLSFDFAKVMHFLMSRPEI